MTNAMPSFEMKKKRAILEMYEHFSNLTSKLTEAKPIDGVKCVFASWTCRMVDLIRNESRMERRKPLLMFYLLYMMMS